MKTVLILIIWLVDYDAKNASNPPYTATLTNIVLHFNRGREQFKESRVNSFLEY